jgi:hypothetical protein
MLLAPMKKGGHGSGLVIMIRKASRISSVFSSAVSFFHHLARFFIEAILDFSH